MIFGNSILSSCRSIIFCCSINIISTKKSLSFISKSLWRLQQQRFQLGLLFSDPKKVKGQESSKRTRGEPGASSSFWFMASEWKDSCSSLASFSKAASSLSRPIVHKTTSYPFLPCCSLFFHFSTWHLLNEFPWNPFFCCESLLPYRTAIFWWNILLLKLREKEVGSQAE